MSRISYFEISAKEPDKLIEFYETVLGWKITKWEGPFDYWQIITGDSDELGINSGMFRPRELFVGTVNTVTVENIDDALEKVIKNNGQVVVEKNTIPGYGYQAYCKDTEGLFSGCTRQILKRESNFNHIRKRSGSFLVEKYPVI